MTCKGLIAIDIDGTLTAERDHLPGVTRDFLHQLSQEGWRFVFVTGRTLGWADKLLNQLPFPYILSVFNGAYTIEMPQKYLIKKRYLTFEQIFRIAIWMGDDDVGMAFYGPPDRAGRAFLYCHHTSHVLTAHLRARAKAIDENWTEIASLTELPLDYFVAMRLFCLPHTAKKYSLKIEEELILHAPMMKDSYDDSFSVVQITHQEASKQEAVKNAKSHIGKVPLVIACGDDHNDISMLEKADVAVVMATAPAVVLSLAHIVAPPAKVNGLIQGLTSAIKFAAK